MNELSLFSGAGLGLLGTKLLGFRCVGYVEKDDYCQKVLRARIRDGYLDDAPIFSDVRSFDGRPYRGRVDLVSAGFPCQPFSSAARGRNTERSLWAETRRIVAECSPQFVFIENVLHARREIKLAANELRILGYRVADLELSASDVGAPHIRKRLWLFGDSDRNGESAITKHEQMARMPTPTETVWKDIRPEDLRVANGVSSRMDRLKALGNGQVPRVVVEAWNRLVNI